MQEPATPKTEWQGRRHEILREASVALRGPLITLWELTREGDAVPVLATGPDPPALDLDATLRRWSVPLRPGSRWVGSRLTGPRWCLAPVRTEPALPPPDGTERRSGERMVLELAGLSLGLLDQASATKRRLPPPEATQELARRPSVIAHEVGNPLTSALASAELGIEAVRGAPALGAPLRAQLLESLTAVEDGIKQAVDFLRALQMEARPARGPLERFNVVDVARACVTLEKPLALKRGVALRFETPLQELYLQGDANGLFRAIVNLIRNAVAASERTRHPVVVALGRSGDMARLTVQDRGRGIAPGDLDRIFEPGYTTEQARGGTGMGLAVVKEIAERSFGGRIAVETKLDEGTSFMLFLPAPPQRSETA